MQTAACSNIYSFSIGSSDIKTRCSLLAFAGPNPTERCFSVLDSATFTRSPFIYQERDSFDMAPILYCMPGTSTVGLKMICPLCTCVNSWIGHSTTVNSDPLDTPWRMLMFNVYITTVMVTQSNQRCISSLLAVLVRDPQNTGNNRYIITFTSPTAEQPLVSFLRCVLSLDW